MTDFSLFHLGAVVVSRMAYDILKDISPDVVVDLSYALAIHRSGRERGDFFGKPQQGFRLVVDSGPYMNVAQTIFRSWPIKSPDNRYELECPITAYSVLDDCLTFVCRTSESGFRSRSWRIFDRQFAEAAIRRSDGFEFLDAECPESSSIVGLVDKAELLLSKKKKWFRQLVFEFS